MEYKKVIMSGAKCGLDLGDGSERAEYVNQDYILNKLGRPHRCVNIMYTCYPRDKQWPARISEACKDMDVQFQWDYPYDDYFPYGANGEPFAQMRDIRKHGQDVLLTLTIDCSLDDEYLRGIARELKPFGRLKIRINHECTGDWFTHNRRFSFEEIGAFFVRFHNIIKEEAPNISTVFCAGMLVGDDVHGVNGESGHLQGEKEYLPAYEVADYWSADKYLALHFGWPYDVAEVGGGRYCFDAVDNVYKCFKDTAKYLSDKFGRKCMTSAEFNADGDVTGPFSQADPVIRFLQKLKDEDADWMKAISMYQFRDRGRLGLEIEDPNNKSVGIEQPLLKEYKKMLSDPFFSPEMQETEEASFPATLRWGGSEDAEGVGCTLSFEKTPEFCEVTLPEDCAVMIDFDGKWFYKAPKVTTIDLMSKFFECPLDGPTKLPIRFFVTPTDGVNPETDAADWATNFYGTLSKEPEFRIRYEVPGLCG